MNKRVLEIQEGPHSAQRRMPGGPLQRRRHRTRPASFGIALAFWAPSAAAAAGDRSADVAAAQALFERGRALMAEQRVAEACPLFEESQALDAGIGTQYNLANCYEAAGRFASAYTLFLEVAATARARGQAERAEVAVGRAHALESKLSRLIIQVEPQQRATLTVERDGSALGSAQWGLAVPVDPGRHQVRARGPGLVPWVREISVGATPQLHDVHIPRLALAGPNPVPCDEQQTGEGCAALTLAAPDSAASPVAVRHTLGLVALGAGVAALGLGTGLALHAHSKNASAEAAGCDDRGCPTQASLNLRRSAVSSGNWATVSTTLGLASVAAGGLLLWILPQPDEARAPLARVLPRLTDEAAGIDVYGRF